MDYASSMSNIGAEEFYTKYFDSKPGVGPSVVSLVDGWFEFDQGYPIQRHSTANYTSVTKNIAFTVRSISTIGNYDYMFSYNFFLDGSIEVSVRASGYIHGGFSANNEEYG
ncbi:Retina-specific copper amine oxidase [Metarhizium anisopliae]|nr:Retina-specific copper amine oxidase [Metarhizium anisopliae]